MKTLAILRRHGSIQGGRGPAMKPDAIGALLGWEHAEALRQYAAGSEYGVRHLDRCQKSKARDAAPCTCGGWALESLFDSLTRKEGTR